MAFTLTSTGVITQGAGETDTSFAGIELLTGGSVATQGNKDIYTLDSDTRLVINGTLSINGEFEELLTERRVVHDVLANIIVAGTWNAGILKSNPGGTTSTSLYTKGTVWRQVGNIITGGFGPNWFNGGFGARDLGSHLAITPTGTVNLNGSTFAGPMMITVALGGTFESEYQANILSDDTDRPAGNEWNCRYYKGDINLGTVAQEGGIIQLEAINSDGGSRVVLVRNNAGVAAWSQSGAENLDGVSFDPSNPGTNYTTLSLDGSNNVVDFAQYGNVTGGVTNAGATRLQDCPRGTDLNINGGETESASKEEDNWGYTWMTRRIGTNIKSLANSSNQEGAFYIKDYNETGNVRSPSTSDSNIDDSPDAIYFGKFDGSLTSLSVTGPYAMTQPDRNNDTEVLIATHNIAAGGSRARATKNTGLWVWDQRSKTTVLGEDEFDTYFWSYENNFFQLSDNLSSGTIGEAHTYDFLTIADTNVTRLRTGLNNIVDLNSTIDSNFVVSNTGITTGTVSVSLDDVYDLVKYKKETSVDNIVIPTATTLILSSDGTEIDMGSNTISQGAGLWSIGTTHTQFKVADDINLSKFVLGGGIGLSCIQFSTVPSTFDNCSLTNSSTTATAGGKTLGSGVVINGDWTYSSAGNAFNHTQTGDITVGDGDNAYGTDFELTGELLLSTGNNTFDSGTDVSNVDLISLGGKAVAVFGKVAADFKSINDTRTGSSITFPAFPTRLDVNISALGTGVPYTLCHNGVIVSSGLSTGTSLQFSNGTSDGSRTQVAEIGGNWSLGIVDADKRCTFNAVDVVVTVESEATQFTLALPSFNSTFNVATTEVGGRTCTVGASDVIINVESDDPDIGVQLNNDFPTSSGSNLLPFSSNADAITFMVALGLTSAGGQQATSGNIFLREGENGIPQDFTGAVLERVGSDIAVRSGIELYSSGVVVVKLAQGVNIFISTGYTAEVAFELEGCIGNSYADQPMTSNLFGKARDSINYIEAMRRRLVKNKVTIPTDGSSVTEDICRSVNDGADIRNGTYLLTR